MATSPDLQDASRTLLQPPRQVQVLHKLNLRGAPSLNGPHLGRLEPGQTLWVDQLLEAEPFLERALWWRVAGQQQFCWAGATRLLEEAVAAPPAPGPIAATPPGTGNAGSPAAQPPGVPAKPAGSAPVVSRRANGSILPLRQAELFSLFGGFQFQEGPRRGEIQIDPGWRQQHLVAFQHAVLQALGQPPLAVHALAAPHFEAVFSAIEQAGLADRLLSCDGSWVPRHKSWNPALELSSHSWGVAIDLNARWNAQNAEPALPGQTGCLRELVPLFNAQGFAWGGHFSSGVDGMHFELARRDL